MAIEVHELERSRQVSQTGARRRYRVTGTSDELVARTSTLAASPTVIDNRIRTDCEAIQTAIEPSVFESTVTYTYQPADLTKDYRFSNSLQGLRIFRSLETIERYDTAGPASGAGNPPNFHGLLNVQPDGRPDGTDLLLPTSGFDIGFSFDGAIPQAYQLLVESLHGKVNSAIFEGRAPGEVLFVGATGSTQVTAEQTKSNLEFSFLRRPNRINVTIEAGAVDITIPAIDGWDYLWVYPEHAEDTATKTMGLIARSANVERLYERADLNQLWTGILP